MKSDFDLFDAIEVLLLTILVFDIGLLLSIPILKTIESGDSRFLLMYAAYVVAVVVAYLIKRKC